jgi:hypothetical protein
LAESVYLLRDALLAEPEYRVGEIENGRSFLAESRERVVWCTVFETAEELLGAWQSVQAAAIQRTQALTPEKSWELYLVLATELDAAMDTEPDLEAVRRDTSYARKVLAIGLEGLELAQVANYLAPIKPLQVPPQGPGTDALERLEQLVSKHGSPEEVAVLEAFKENRPLFGGL